MIPTSIPAIYADELEADPNVRLAESPPGKVIALLFNMSADGKQNPAILDPEVRSAVDHAIDKQKIIEVALLGRGTICPPRWRCGPFRSDLQDPTLEATPYDPDLAMRILDDAGYPDLNDDGIREGPEGEPLTLRLQFDSTFPPNVTATDIVKEGLQAIGIATEVEMVEESTLMNTMMGQEDYDIAVALVGQDPGPVSFYDWRLSCWSAPLDSGGNLTNYCNDQFEGLLGNLFSTFGDGHKQATFAADRFFAQERPFISLAGVNQLGAYRIDRLEMDEDVYPDYSYLFGWWNVMNMTVK
jgi:peptide/nickel transport system substrate-binding protein